MTDLGNTIILLLKTLKLREYACRDAEIDQITQILLQPLMKIIIDSNVTIPTAVSSAYAGMKSILFRLQWKLKVRESEIRVKRGALFDSK